MGNTIHAVMLEMLASKICHDLISPIGAVSNGVEFLNEMVPDADDEVSELIKYSAMQASGKLQCYRMAYGAGGADTSIKPEDVHKIFALMIEADGKITQNWDPYAPLGPEERPAGLAKLLMCALILCTECLPRGGEISVESDGADGIRLIARGENAAMFARAPDALSMNIAQEAIEPRLVHPYMCGLIAQHHNFSFRLEKEEQGEVSFLLHKN